MQLINNFEKIMVKSSAFRTNKDNLRSLKYPNIICLYAWGIQKKLQWCFCHFSILAYTEAVHYQAAAIYTYGNFQESSMVLFTICVMIILNPKQFPGSSVSYLQNYTQILRLTWWKSVLSL